MYMFKNRIKYFTIIHVFTLLITGIYTTSKMYYEYALPNEKTNKLNEFTKIYSNKYSLIYMRYTGTETGFGFFAPNVKSNGVLFGTLGNKNYSIDFNTNEGNSRLSSLFNAVTDKMLKEVVNDKDKKDDLIDKINNLIVKNIAVKLKSNLKNNNSGEIFDFTYSLFEYPPLSMIKKGIKKKLKITEVKKWSYEIK
jgi:hypothetical protein